MVADSNPQDAFRNGNILQLISRSTGYPLIIRNNSLMGNGSFVKNDSKNCVKTTCISQHINHSHSTRHTYTVNLTPIEDSSV